MSHPLLIVGTMFGQHDELQLAVQEASKRIADLEFDEYSGDDATKLVAKLRRHRAIVDAAISRGVLRVDHTRSYEKSGHRNTASQQAATGGIARSQAQNEIDTAKKLEALPATSQAFRNGEISSTQASLIASAATDSKSENELLKLAQTDSVGVLDARARKMRSNSGAEEEADKDRKKRALRTCRVNADRPDGMGSLWFVGMPEEIAVLKSRLDRRRDRIFREKRKRGVHDSFECNMADAFMSLISEEESGKSRSKKRHVDATLIVDYTALKRGYRESNETSEIAGCGEVSVATARELLDDAMFRILVVDGIDVKTVTSKTRYWNSSVRAALEYRDRRCVVPGCESTFRLEKDHDKWFSRGGETRLDNGRHLCPHHHALVTNKGFRLVGEPGNWRWLAPGQLDVEIEADP